MINSGNFETQKPVKIIGLSITKKPLFCYFRSGNFHMKKETQNME